MGYRQEFDFKFNQKENDIVWISIWEERNMRRETFDTITSCAKILQLLFLFSARQMQVICFESACSKTIMTSDVVHFGSATRPFHVLIYMLVCIFSSLMHQNCVITFFSELYRCVGLHIAKISANKDCAMKLSLCSFHRFFVLVFWRAAGLRCQNRASV